MGQSNLMTALKYTKLWVLLDKRKKAFYKRSK